MTGILANKGMGNLVQDDLFNLVQGGVANEVFADGNSASSKITLSSSPDRSVKTEAVVHEPMHSKEPMRKIDDLRAHRGNPRSEALCF